MNFDCLKAQIKELFNQIFWHPLVLIILSSLLIGSSQFEPGCSVQIHFSFSFILFVVLQLLIYLVVYRLRVLSLIMVLGILIWSEEQRIVTSWHAMCPWSMRKGTLVESAFSFSFVMISLLLNSYPFVWFINTILFYLCWAFKGLVWTVIVFNLYFLLIQTLFSHLFLHMPFRNVLILDKFMTVPWYSLITLFFKGEGMEMFEIIFMFMTYSAWFA